MGYEGWEVRSWACGDGCGRIGLRENKSNEKGDGSDGSES